MDKKIEAALLWAADAIKAQDGGDVSTDTGWASPEALEHWLTIRQHLGERAVPPRSARGGPTVDDPQRPYCKPDQSCCDFVCGN